MGPNLHGRDIEVNSRMETNLPGVYAAGDITAYDGKLKLIATGVGEICIAVNVTKTRVDPNSKFMTHHSTNLGLS